MTSFITVVLRFFSYQKCDCLIGAKNPPKNIGDLIVATTPTKLMICLEPANGNKENKIGRKFNIFILRF